MSSNAVADNFLAYASNRMHLSQTEIARCLDKLTADQMNHRGGDYENSITNLLLHLEGNMRQWILHGIDDQPNIRQRDNEFALALSIPPTEARANFNATLNESARVIAAVDPERLLVVIDPQPDGTWRHLTILEAIFKVVSHLEMHTGQIILLTKQLTASDRDLSMPRKR
jgi:uncharacterized damage-inducible protein DinB